jgi:predicted dehydrogenase
MYESGLCDAVIIATPHYWHGPLTILAARAGIDVLCEKPLEARIGVARAMVRECKKRKVALGVMFQHRARASMIHVKKMIDAGEIGEISRIQLIASNWFRTQAYYDSGAWRGTWDGEGGGVLINQLPHQLDLFRWFAGEPKRMMGIVSTRAHKIEVEDTANLLMEFSKGKIGYIYATTAEEPGLEQFMICGDKGTLTVSGEHIRFARLSMPIPQHIMGSKQAAAGGAEQKTDWQDIKAPEHPAGHIEIIRGFAKHLVKGTPMYADGQDGVNELTLSNAAYLAGYKNKTVEFPVDAKEIDALIAKLERERSTGRGGGLRRQADKSLRKLIGKNYL